MAHDTEQASGLSREAVIDAAMTLLDGDGIEGLSMRALADRLGVKAASLYWHLRDKEQLLELMAEAVLDRVDVPISASGWRDEVSAACAALEQVVRRRPAVGAVVLGSLRTVPRSRLGRDLGRVLGGAGLTNPEAAAYALIVQAVAGAAAGLGGRSQPGPRRTMTLGVDSGSWRVVVRAAAPGSTDIASSVGGGGAPSIDVRQDGLVLVRNRRGGNRGAVELSPEHTWHIKVHGGTWNTLLDLTGLRISGIELDSGAGNVTCTLPEPAGSVPVKINSGIIGVTLRRPPHTAASATVMTGSAKVRIDGQSLRPTATDIHWETPGGARAEDRYDVTVHSGCVKVTIDASAPSSPAGARGRTPSAEPDSSGLGHDRVIDLILDGITAAIGSDPQRR